MAGFIFPEWVWCETCDCAAMVCPECGNTTCTGGQGELESGQRCNYCLLVYDEYEKASKDGIVPKSPDGLRVVQNVLRKLFKGLKNEE